MERIRKLPAVSRVVDAASAAADSPLGASRERLAAAAREAIGDVRARALRGDPPPDDCFSVASLAVETLRRAASATSGTLVPVVNLTGVVLHTNLGRAPLDAALVAEITPVLTSWCNLEFDLELRRRGHRHDHVVALLRRLAPAEAGLIVNNNAAAVLLALAALAAGRDVVISRGELVEVGGGFRIPDVLAASGARLVEVGTTNRTRVDDYARAIGPETAMLFKAHRSNFRIVGFTEEASWAAVAALAHQHGLWAVADLGSGTTQPGLVPGADEPSPADLVRAGFDLVCFSGDKALGGPQAGIVLGRQEAIDRLRRHPLLRAVRVGRFTIAALEATLKRILEGRTAEVPVLAALSLPAEAVRTRCRRLVRAAHRAGAAGLDLRVVPVRSAVGGGAFPGGELPSWGVEVRRTGWSETAVEAMLRRTTPPVLGRLAEGRLVLDLRTLLPGQEATVVASLVRLAAAPDPGPAAPVGGFDGGRGPEEDAGGDAPGDG